MAKIKTILVVEASLLNEHGKGAWIGHHAKHGWIVLDRMFSYPGKYYYFVRVSDWSLLPERCEVFKQWEPYIFYGIYLASRPDTELEVLSNSIKSLCAQFSLRRSALKAAVLAHVKSEEEKKLPIISASEHVDIFAADDATFLALSEEKKRARREKIDSIKAVILARNIAERVQIEKQIRSRNIQFLTHFTSLNNLVSILGYGILPRAEIPPYAHINDDRRLDEFREATSLSVSFPNCAMFFKYREERGGRWAVIGITPDVIWSNPCLFYADNAARKGAYARVLSTPENFSGEVGFNAMFAAENRGRKRLELNISESFTTNPQAELLIFDVILLDKIKFIFFQDMHPDALQKMGAAYPHINFLNNPSLFSSRIDHRSSWAQGTDARFLNKPAD